MTRPSQKNNKARRRTIGGLSTVRGLTIEQFDQLLRKDFLCFTQRCFNELDPNAPFLMNWHIKAIAYHLELVLEGKIKRLVINLPPRSLKSIMCSVALPAFVLGHDPSKRVIVASYGSELAIKLGNDCRSILQSNFYRQLFPGTRVSSSKNTEFEVTTTRRGFRMATSMAGTLTGRGADIIIIDDPLKAQDADSDSKREAVNDWFFNTVPSRLNDVHTGAIIVVMQRLHLDDLTGRLLERGGWTVLSFPAIAEQDEWVPIGEDEAHRRKAGTALHPQRVPLDKLYEIRSEVGSRNFAAQYQQSPLPSDGNMIKRGWIKRYLERPERTSSTFVLQSWDTAAKDGETNSWSVCTTIYVIEGKYYLIDVIRARLDYPDLKEQAIAHAKRHRADAVLIEDIGVGTALAAELRKGGITVIPVKVEHSKATRMSIQAAKFKSGQVYLPQQAPWLEDLEKELFAFPGSRFNDQVDSLSQALAYEIKKSPWSDERSVEGFGKLVEGLVMDQLWGRMMGRPW